MGRYAILQGGVAVNVVEAEADFAAAQGWISAPDAAIGDLWDGQAFTPPAPTPAPVPEIISPRQFRQSLTHFAYRANIENAIAASDQDTKDWYEFATQFERHHPMVIGMAQQLGYTEAQIDDVWTYGAAL